MACSWNLPLDGSNQGQQSAPASQRTSDIVSNHMASALSSLFDSGKYSDLVIKCGSQQWKVHKAIVCTQSKPISAAIDGGFIESHTGEFILEEEDPQNVQLMLKYMYTGTLDIEDSTKSCPQAMDSRSSAIQIPYQPNYQYSSQFLPTDQNPPINHLSPSTYDGFNDCQGPRLIYRGGVAYTVIGTPPPMEVEPNHDTSSSAETLSLGLISAAEVYILADKYDVCSLKVLACEKYKSLCASCWNTEEFITSISTIFDGTPDTKEKDSLRFVALDTSVTHAKALLAKENFLELCQYRGDIATAVLMASIDKPYPAPYCGSVMQYPDFVPY